MLGYADESGEPGIKKNEHDYFVFCIVLLKNREQVANIEKEMERFRRNNRLTDNHELHYATDSKKTRANFARFIRKLDFDFVSVSIKKDTHQKTASFPKMAHLILDVLEKNHLDVKIIMDTNPRLRRELRVAKKGSNSNSHFSEKKSRGNSLIQLADYVTAIRTRYIKYSYKTTVAKMYLSIRDKLLDEINT